MPFKQGFIVSINSIKCIIQNFFNMKYQFICLNRFNQDHIENLFLLLRSYGGKNIHSTIMQCRAALKSCLFNDLIKPLTNSKNCMNDKDVTLLNSCFITNHTVKTKAINTTNKIIKKSHQLLVNQAHTIYENLATDYVAGYLELDFLKLSDSFD